MSNDMYLAQSRSNLLLADLPSNVEMNRTFLPLLPFSNLCLSRARIFDNASRLNHQFSQSLLQEPFSVFAPTVLRYRHSDLNNTSLIEFQY